MANSRHSTQAGNPAVDVDVGDEALGDAIGDVRHRARILTLAIIGYIHSPHDVHGAFDALKPDHNWAFDLESVAFDLVHKLNDIDEAVNGRAGS